MGSSGSGNFSDYSGTLSKGTSKSKTGGSSDEDKCAKAFSSYLDEVQTCEYFKKRKDVPVTNSVIEVIFRTPRLAVVTEAGLIVGYLPTDKNYIRGCLKSGYKFPGIITSARKKPIPSLQITVSPYK